MEQHKRTITRAFSWRVTATIVTALWIGIESAIWMNIVMTLIHFVHERIWLKVEWGLIKEKST